VHADLQRALAAPSLEDDVLAFLARRGLPVPAEVLDRDRTVTHEAHPAVTAVWASVYRDPRPGNELFALGKALTDVAEEFTTWRQRHVTAVRRSMGAKPGTGGSAGLAWLERSAERPVFPDLWAARTVI
jgi:tryptophan 2,3-dioxygenase